MEYWNVGILGKKEKGFIGLQTHHSIVPSFQYSSSLDGFRFFKPLNIVFCVSYLL